MNFRAACENSPLHRVSGAGHLGYNGDQSGVRHAAGIPAVSSLPQSGDWELIAFGEFEFSPSRLELRREGEPVRLQQQPLKVLAALLRRPGELVTREELRAEVWEPGIHLDFDDALNHAVKYLRDALGDKAGKPRFVETVPRRGYRFVAPVQLIEARPLVPAVVSPNEQPALALPLPQTVQPVRLPMHWVAIAGLVLLAVGLSMWKSSTARSAPRVLSAVQLTHFGLAHAVVSDGTHLYVDQTKAGIHSIVVFPADGSGPPTPLVTPFSDVHLLDLSPDRKRLLVAVAQAPSTRYELWELPLSGARPRKIGDIDTASAKWSPDGRKIAFAGAFGGPSGLYIADADGSNARFLTANATYVESWSPDGASIRFSRMNVSGGLSMWEIGVNGEGMRLALPADTIRYARWGEGQCCGRWTPDGKYFLYEEATERSTRIMAVPDHALLGPSDKPAAIYSASFQGSGIGSSIAIGPRNQLLMIGWNEKRELARYDAQIGKFVPVLTDIEAREIAYSRDRRELAYTALPGLALWKVDFSSRSRRQLTFGPGQTFGPTWSPDGKKIAVHVLFPGKPGKVEIVPADGGTPQVLFANENTQEDSQNWSPDGQALLVGRDWLDEHGTARSSSYWIVDLSSGKTTKVPGSDNIGSVSWSPNGRYLAAQSEDFRKLMLFDFQTARWKTVATGALIWRPLWSQDSRSLLYQDARDGEQQPIYRLTIASGKVEKVTSRSAILEPNLSSYSLVGITADNMPIVTLLRRNSDVYALDVKLP